MSIYINQYAPFVATIRHGEQVLITELDSLTLFNALAEAKAIYTQWRLEHA
jgi:hypothetical protein